MAAPAFGFSVGDFISAFVILNDIRKALQDSGGAEEEFREVLLDLQQLEIVLQWLEGGNWGRSGDLSHVNAIRGMALTCQVPLKEFWGKIQKYKAMASDQSQVTDVTGKVKVAAKKVQWAVRMKSEVAKFRTVIVSKVVALNLLMAIPLEPRLAKLESDIASSDRQSREEARTLMGKVEDCLIATQQVTKEGRIMKESQALAACNVSRLVEICTGTQLDVAKIQQVVRGQYGSINARLARMEWRQQQQLINSDNGYGTFGSSLKRIERTQRRALTLIPTSVQAISLCIGNLKTIIEQLVHIFGEFSVDVLRALNRVLRTNLEIYALLRRIQDQLSDGPSPELRDCIHFKDALGRTRNLQYEWFRHWEVFESMLRCEFSSLPGEELVLTGRYHLMRGTQQRRIVSKEEWNMLVYPGADLSMSIIVESDELDEGMCPRPGCGQRNLRPVNATRSVICCSCGLEYYEEQEEFSKYFPRVWELHGSSAAKTLGEDSLLSESSRYSWSGNDMGQLSGRSRLLSNNTFANSSGLKASGASLELLQIFKSVHMGRKNLKDHVLELCMESILIYEPPDVIHDIVETITARAPAQHRFLWADGMINFLEKVNEGTTRQALSQLPRDLDELYDMVMCNIDDASWELAERVLSWLLVAKRPLPIQPLKLALSVASRSTPKNSTVITMEQIRRACKFLVRETNDQTVDFIHITVREYLQRSYGKWWDTEKVRHEVEALFRVSQEPGFCLGVLLSCE